MFGKGKLIREGAQAQGVVIYSFYARSEGGGAVAKYKVKVRVQFDDGSTAELSSKLDWHEVGSYTEGDILPVRYDPENRSRIEIDVPALRALKEAQTRNAKAQAVARGERELAAATGAPPAGSPPQTPTFNREAAAFKADADALAATLRATTFPDGADLERQEQLKRRGAELMRRGEELKRVGAQQPAGERSSPEQQAAAAAFRAAAARQSEAVAAFRRAKDSGDESLAERLKREVQVGDAEVQRLNAEIHRLDA